MNTSEDIKLRTPLGRVRGLGSAKTGTHHWWAQRLTAVALVPLTLWFVAVIVNLTGGDYATAVMWLRSPLVTTMMVLLILATCYHAQLGLQVVIEDYVHVEWLKVTGLIAIKFGLLVLAVVCVVAVIRVALGGNIG